MKNTIPLKSTLTIIFTFWLSTYAIPASSQIHFDFEDGSLQGWRVVEGAFDRIVCDCEFFHTQPNTKYNKQGKYYLNTLERSNGSRTDAFTGIIESPVFFIDGDEVSFLVGGGNHSNTYVALCNMDGDEIFKANGDNSEVMKRITWDVAPLNDKQVFLRIVDDNKGGWGHVTFDDFQAEGAIDEEATNLRFEKVEKARKQKQIRETTDRLTNTLNSTQKAVSNLIESFGEDFPNGKRSLSDIAAYREKLISATYVELDSLSQKIKSLQRSALLQNPLVQNHPILFVARNQYLPDHHSTATLFQNGEINENSFRGKSALKTFDPQTGETSILVDCPQGVVRDPEIHFDGARVIFSMRRSKDDDYHIYELNLKTNALRQITDGPEISDFDPVYLPDGDIVFASTREPKYCQCNRHIMGNLFRMNADGGAIRQIGRNTLFEGHPVLLPDGRLLYDRWEYVDKHFGPAFGLWTSNPDGTNHLLYYGNNAWSPGAIVDARPIPNTDRVVATFGSCHDRPWGAIAVIDRQIDLDGVDPVVQSWPADITSYLPNNTDYGTGTVRNHPRGGQIDTFKNLPVKYEDPFPLSNKYFLCSRSVEGERMGIFLLDVFGNELCIHQEELGCFDPMPIQKISTPQIVPSRVDYAKNTGFFYVTDVYNGSGMDNVSRGTVKILRVVEAPVKLFWTQTNWNLDATQAPAMNFNCTNNKRILGDVPVESDGSAYFEVPADSFVFFQLLDENGKMVQSMRSGTIVRPGEMQGCVGCHENRLSSVNLNDSPLAMQRPPSPLKSWYGEPRDFNYLTEVQPVFDRYCVSCHDYGQKAGEKLNLADDLGLVFNTSYLDLRRKSALRWFKESDSDNAKKKLLVKAVDDGPPEALPAYSWGSHCSRLVDVVQNGHQGIELDKESFDRIVTWIDMNAPYYGSYASVYPDNVFGRSPLNNNQIEELRKLTGIQVGDISTELQGSQCNFTRPEFSPCLSGLKEADPEKYQKALAIIEEGKNQLQKKPRMDMHGAQMLESDRAKLNKYKSRIQQEKEARKKLVQNSAP